MLKGTPYWGETTFQDKRSLLQDLQDGVVRRELPSCISACTSLFETFRVLGRNQFMFIIENQYFSWCKDIRMDYRDKVIFIPYYEYMTTLVKTNQEHKHLDRISDGVLLTYNYELKIMPVDLSKLIFTVVSLDEMCIYEIDLTNLPLLDFQPSVVELYNYYKNASFFDEAWSEIDFINNYHWISSEQGRNIEAVIRSANRLPVWKLGNHIQCTDFVKRIIAYCDIRLYNLQVLHTVFHFKLDYSLLYWERRYLFEAYLLFTSLSDMDFVEAEFNAKWRDLGTRIEMFSYGEKDFPMYLKHYYKTTDFFPRKTYEKYIEKLW